MKKILFILCLLFLVACGKDNKSGSRPAPVEVVPDQFRTDAEINEVRYTRNGVMVEGNVQNFAIPVRNVTNIFRSRNLVGVIYNDNGLRVAVYNAMGNAILKGTTRTINPRLNVRDDIATLEFQDHRGYSRYIAVNSRRVLIDIAAENIRAKLEYGVAAVTYGRRGNERAIAVKSNGRILVQDNQTYRDARFEISMYVLLLYHSRDVVSVQH